MTFDEYQTEAIKTAIYPKSHRITYPALGLAGEVGEVCEKIKKTLRDSAGVFGPTKREELKKELGDVLWYIAALCEDLSISMDDTAAENIAKLKSRQERGKLQGSGDER